MRGLRRWAAALGGGLLGTLILAPGPVHAATSNTQFCGILGVDPDSVTVIPPNSDFPRTASIVASETPAELGPGAPTVRLFVFRTNGANPVLDLVDGLTGPSTSGGASLSGPATSPTGVATEHITFTRPGTYTFGFLALFDNGIHPCTSLLPTNHTVTVTVA